MTLQSAISPGQKHTLEWHDPPALNDVTNEYCTTMEKPSQYKKNRLPCLKNIMNVDSRALKPAQDLVTLFYNISKINIKNIKSQSAVSPNTQTHWHAIHQIILKTFKTNKCTHACFKAGQKISQQYLRKQIQNDFNDVTMNPVHCVRQGLHVALPTLFSSFVCFPKRTCTQFPNLIR